MLELATVYVWNWVEDRGTLVIGVPPAVYGWEGRGDAHRVLVRFEGEKVVSVDHSEGPSPECSDCSIIPTPALLREASQDELQMEGKAASPAFRLDSQGNLWIKDGAQQEERLAMAASFPPVAGESPPQVMAISPDGHFVAVLRNGDTRVWGTEAEKVVAVLPPPSAMEQRRHISWNAHAQAVFTADGNRILLSDNLGGLRMIRVGTWQTIWAWKQPFEPPFVLAPDESRILIRSGSLHLLDGETGVQTGVIEPRRLEHWFNVRLDLDWLHFAVHFLTPETILACGPATEEHWSVRELERSYREKHQPARIGNDVMEPALLKVCLRP